MVLPDLEAGAEVRAKGHTIIQRQGGPSQAALFCSENVEYPASLMAGGRNTPEICPMGQKTGDALTVITSFTVHISVFLPCDAIIDYDVRGESSVFYLECFFIFIK